jgi:uncharacterized protein YxjI
MRYAVRERMFSIGEDFWITDERGDRVLLADGKVMRLRQTVELKDGSGAVVAVVRKKLMAVRETMEVERDGALAATVHKALISPLHHRSVIDLADGGQLEAVGNILDKEFEITGGGRTLARISRAWFRLRDTYGVDVAPGEDDVLFLAIAVALDRIQHDEDERRERR